MNNTETIALAKVLGEKMKAFTDARGEIEAGEYEVDFLAHITGSFKVGEDYEQHIVAKADPWSILAIALSKLNGVTVESLIREVTEELGDEITTIKAQAKEAMEVVKGKTLTSCKGKITKKLTAETVVEAS